MVKMTKFAPAVVVIFAAAMSAMPVTSAVARGGTLSDMRQRESQMARKDVFPQGQKNTFSAIEAVVEPGTLGAAIARKAADCSARFKSYDASNGTYVGRDGIVRRCR